MIINTVRGRVKPEFKETFIKKMISLSETVRAEEGCITYELSIVCEEPLITFLYEQWESQAAITAHLATPHMQKHFAEASPWFDSVTRETYEASSVSLDLS